MKVKLVQSETLSSRNATHLLRRLWHLGCSLLLAYAYWEFFTKEQALLVMTTLGTIFLLGDSFRLKYTSLNKAILKIMGGFMRKSEMQSQSAMMPFILSLFIVIVLFPKPVVILSILYLGVGDPVASIVGIHYGNTKIFGTRKSLEGVVANFFVTTIITYFVLSAFALGGSYIVLISLMGGAGSALSESLPLATDDNLHVPILSGAFLWLALVLF